MPFLSKFEGKWQSKGSVVSIITLLVQGRLTVDPYFTNLALSAEVLLAYFTSEALLF